VGGAEACLLELFCPSVCPDRVRRVHAPQCAALCDAGGPDCCCDPNAVFPLSTTIVDSNYAPQASFPGYWGYNYSAHTVTFVPPVVTTAPTASYANYTRTMTYQICMTGNNREWAPVNDVDRQKAACL
jgi:hypothetical protein